MLENQGFSPIDFVDEPDEPVNIDRLTSLYAVLEGVDFPISRNQLAKIRGDRAIDWTGEATIPLRKVLSYVKQDEFGSISDVKAAIGEQLDTIPADTGKAAF